MEGPEPVLTNVVIVVFSQLYPTRRKKVKADSEEEEGEGDQQQASFSLLLRFKIKKCVILPKSFGSSSISLRISDSGCEVFSFFSFRFFILLNLKKIYSKYGTLIVHVKLVVNSKYHVGRHKAF